MAPYSTEYDCQQQIEVEYDPSSRSCHSRIKSVSFSEDIAVGEVLALNDYSMDERLNTWYSKADIRSWKTQCKAMMRDGIPIDCERGLENRSSDGSRRKRQNKRAARRAVFQEQSEQREEGIYDPEAIADAYFDANEPCQVVAIMTAMRDEVEAKIILSEDIGYSMKFPLVPTFQVRLGGCAFLPQLVTSSAA